MSSEWIESEINVLKNLAKLRMVPFDEDVLRERLNQKPKFTVTPWGSRQINDSEAILRNARLQIENYLFNNRSKNSSNDSNRSDSSLFPTKEMTKEWEKVEGVHVSLFWLPKAMKKFAFCPKDQMFYQINNSGLWEKVENVDEKLWRLY